MLLASRVGVALLVAAALLALLLPLSAHAAGAPFRLRQAGPAAALQADGKDAERPSRIATATATTSGALLGGRGRGSPSVRPSAIGKPKPSSSAAAPAPRTNSTSTSISTSASASGAPKAAPPGPTTSETVAALRKAFLGKKLPPMPPADDEDEDEDECAARNMALRTRTPPNPKQQQQVRLSGAPSRSPSLLEAQAESQSQADTALDTQASTSTNARAFPVLPPYTALPNLGLVRQAVRGGGAFNVDPVPGACAGRAGFVASRVGAAGAGTTAVCYYLDMSGRPCQVFVENVVTGGATAPGTLADHYCDILFDPRQTLGAWAVAGRRTLLPGLPANYNLRYTQVFESGHMVAASLGGSNQDPLNFFPQYINANRGAGSTWKAMEDTARKVKTACTALAASGVLLPGACLLSIELLFDYNGVPNMPVGTHNNVQAPSGGTYILFITYADYNVMWPQAAPAVAGGSPGPRALHPAVPAHAKLTYFFTHAMCTPLLTHCGLVNTWLNQ